MALSGFCWLGFFGKSSVFLKREYIRTIRIIKIKRPSASHIINELVSTCFDASRPRMFFVACLTISLNSSWVSVCWIGCD